MCRFGCGLVAVWLQIRRGETPKALWHKGQR
nr:MAG TPA: hypothetical protein [Caudoviricetes sp.]